MTVMNYFISWWCCTSWLEFLQKWKYLPFSQLYLYWLDSSIHLPYCTECNSSNSCKIFQQKPKLIIRSVEILHLKIYCQKEIICIFCKPGNYVMCKNSPYVCCLMKYLVNSNCYFFRRGLCCRWITHFRLNNSRFCHQYWNEPFWTHPMILLRVVGSGVLRMVIQFDFFFW